MKKWAAAAAVLFVGLMATVSQASDDRAEKAFDGHMSHDFGTVPCGTVLSHRFKFSNPYKVPLKIGQLRPAMGHTVTAEATQECLQPGETAYIEVSMYTKYFVGPRTVAVYVSMTVNGIFSEARLEVTANSQEK
jgi:hypothetical protein